ncbi:MAG: chromate transporter [Lachnospiraceae bacterium]|nr:chromate transporter [Lachnospiraceae bacterium]
MIYIKLFLEFMKIGLFSFGGAYGAIPLIQDCVLRNEWMDVGMFSNMLAISESTPGPIMVNAATYIGNVKGGYIGAIVATIGVVLPSFVIILLISVCLSKWMQGKRVQAVLKGIKPCLVGMILATGCYMALDAVLVEKRIEWQALLILGILVCGWFLFKQFRKKEPSPIVMIVISACLGAFLY